MKSCIAYRLPRITIFVMNFLSTSKVTASLAVRDQQIASHGETFTIMYVIHFCYLAALVYFAIEIAPFN